MGNNNGIYITRPLTFKYTCHIDKRETGFDQIRRDLNRSLVDYTDSYRRSRSINENYYHEATYFVVNNLFQKRFLFEGNTNAYLTNYSENEGSLIVSFTVLIVGAFSNYGSIRETADYFAEDIERLFTSALSYSNVGYSVTTNIQDLNSPTAYVASSVQTNNENDYKSLLNKIKANRILIGIVLFILLLFLLIDQNYIDGLDNSKQNISNEREIREIVQDELRTQKIDAHLKSIAADTIYINK